MKMAQISEISSRNPLQFGSDVPIMPAGPNSVPSEPSRAVPGPDRNRKLDEYCLPCFSA